MEPKGVGTPFANKQTRQLNKGLKPKPTNMLAGIAMAVPKPAIPSMNPPKHHAINKTMMRRSLLTDAIICLMISIAPVRNVRLYVKTAAMITIMIGHTAIAKPSARADAISMIGICQYVMARMALMIKEPIAALNVGHLKRVNATISHRIGNNARINTNRFKISPLSNGF